MSTADPGMGIQFGERVQVDKKRAEAINPINESRSHPNLYDKSDKCTARHTSDNTKSFDLKEFSTPPPHASQPKFSAPQWKFPMNGELWGPPSTSDKGTGSESRKALLREVSEAVSNYDTYKYAAGGFA
jgi:hypothetical protein